MYLFYTTDNQQTEAFLHDQEAKHCAQVLRHQPGDTISWMDGKGTLYTGKLLTVHKKSCRMEITERQENYGKRDYHIHLGVAPTKQMSRYEWFAEKSTELGIDRITPIICQHSERRKIRTDRLEKIVLGAAKQSLKAYLPEITPPLPFSDFLDMAPAAKNTQKYIAHLTEDSEPLSAIYQPGQNVLLLIGPEGDFSPSEIKAAIAKGFHLVHLGPSRLRTETAGIVACHSIHLINQ